MGIGLAVIQPGHRVLYREAHILLAELAGRPARGRREACLAHVTTVPLLIIDDLSMRKLPQTAAEDLLEIMMRRYERVSTLIPRTVPSRTGASSSATRPRSPPFWTACSITRMC
jgi:DNA replication protein DnaC